MNRARVPSDLPPLLVAARRRVARHLRGAEKIAKPKNNYLAEKPPSHGRCSQNAAPVGAPRGNRNALKTGYYGTESRDRRRHRRALKRDVRDVLTLFKIAATLGVTLDPPESWKKR